MTLAGANAFAGYCEAPATRAGVGYSELSNSRAAGEEAARAALMHAGVAACDLVLLFASGKHDARAFRDGVRSVVGLQPRMIGGTADGVISSEGFGYEGYQAAVAVLSSGTVTFELLREPDVTQRERESGRALGRAIAAAAPGRNASVLLFLDLVAEHGPGGFRLHSASELLKGLREALDHWPPLAGTGLIGNNSFAPPFQFFDERIEQRTASALVLRGSLRMDTTTLHGYRPASGYHTVTATDGNTILAIDGRPALEMLSDLIGADASSSWEDFPVFIMLGINRGEPFEEFQEENYLIRGLVAVDRERNGLVVSGGGPPVGEEFQIMRRSVDFAYVRERVQALLERVRGRRPVFAFYVNCAGREGTVCGTEEEDAEEVRRILGPDLPLIGVYSGCEMGPVRGGVEALNYTGVLCLFTEEA